jgi:hypothetical protein
MTNRASTNRTSKAVQVSNISNNKSQKPDFSTAKPLIFTPPDRISTFK